MKKCVVKKDLNELSKDGLLILINDLADELDIVAHCIYSHIHDESGLGLIDSQTLLAVAVGAEDSVKNIKTFTDRYDCVREIYGEIKHYLRVDSPAAKLFWEERMNETLDKIEKLTIDEMGKELIKIEHKETL